MLTPSICLIMTLSQNMRLNLSLCQCLCQILIQTMSLLWICDLLHLLCLFMVNPQGDDLGDEQGVNPGGEQGGCQGVMHQHQHAYLLHITVPVLHTMMHGHHTGCQHMGILFAPSAMLNTG